MEEKENTLKNKAKAISKYNRISMKKMLATIRALKDISNKNKKKYGQPLSYVEAMAILSSSPRKSSLIIYNTLKDAYHNMVNIQENADEETVFIDNIIVNEGPTMKRIKPRARGRADRIKKRTSHLKVEVIYLDNI